MRKLAMTAGLVALLTLLAALPARATPSTTTKTGGAPRYAAIDVGTLGGPNTFPNTPGTTISDSGIFVGSAETPDIYPFPQWCDGCHVSDAVQWRNGTMTDLGTLGGYSAGLFELNGAGVGVGFSETGALDPFTDAPVTHAAISTHGHLVDLGTLGGTQSWASAINDRGDVSGSATNTTPDPYAAQAAGPLPSTTQWHATLWHDGRMRDLGTLGGPDSVSGLLNERDQAAGWSMTNSTPNDTTGLPTIHPFLWQNGRMRDIGTLGGVIAEPTFINSRGQESGWSNLAGDQTHHPFVSNGTRLLDLGTLGGDNGMANWINDAGAVAGVADLPDGTHHGFLWKNGAMHDLAPIGGAPCSNAYAINGRDQVVGNVTDCHGNSLGAALWDHGTAYDLTQFAPPSAFLSEAYYINDRGEIAAFSLLPNGDMHQVVLVPADLAKRQGLPTASLGTQSAASAAARRRTVRGPRDVLARARGHLTLSLRPSLP